LIEAAHTIVLAAGTLSPGVCRELEMLRDRRRQEDVLIVCGDALIEEKTRSGVVEIPDSAFPSYPVADPGCPEFVGFPHIMRVESSIDGSELASQLAGVISDMSRIARMGMSEVFVELKGRMLTLNTAE
jgi:hypothetical protein